MNLYDKAHDLAKALKEAPEFIEYKKKYDEVMTDESKKERVMSYRSKLMDFQMANMGKEKIDEEDLKRIQDLQESLFADREIGEFMIAEAAFARTFTDVNKIIAEAVDVENGKY